jgi:type VI secretion system secreted protein VgrG
MNADGTIQIYGPQRVDINPDGVKVPKIKAATPSEDEEEKLDEFGEPIEEFDIMGDPSAFAEGDGGAATSQFGAIADAATKSPADAPTTVDMSNMQGDFQRQWDNSFPGGVSQEHGGTIVSDSSGNLSMINEGGGGRRNFSPDLTVNPDQSVAGVFHTHPYDSTEGGYVGVSLSGADAAYMINNNQNIVIAQSGEDQFMYMRTADTPASVDSTALNNAQSARVYELCDAGHDFSAASRIAAKETAEQNGLAYYEGRDGKFSKVPP